MSSEGNSSTQSEVVEGPLLTTPPSVAAENTLTSSEWGMVAFLTSETAFFGTLIAVYISYLGTDRSGPTPGEVLSLQLVTGTTLCLLLSSLTIHLADRSLGQENQSRFRLWWISTILLGTLFLMGTAYEWNDLITRSHLTISRNLFGTTFYTLVGFHSLHVTVGVLIMLLMLGLAYTGQVTTKHHTGVRLVSWYWHFVDSVWVIVFTVVYVVGR